MAVPDGCDEDEVLECTGRTEIRGRKGGSCRIMLPRKARKKLGLSKNSDLKMYVRFPDGEKQYLERNVKRSPGGLYFQLPRGMADRHSLEDDEKVELFLCSPED